MAKKKKYYPSGLPQEGRLKLAQFLRGAGRGVAKTLLALVILAILLVLGVRFFVTPEALEARIRSQLEKTFGRRVEIGHVTLLHLQGIKLSRLVVYESDDFPGDEHLSSEFVIAKYKFGALLRGRIELREVLLMEPRIHLVRRRDGVWNIESMRGAASSPEGGAFALPPLHAAERLRIQRGSLSVRDEKANRRLRVDDFDFTARGFAFDRAFPVRADFTTEARTGGTTYRVRVGFEGEVDLGNFLPDAAEIKADELSVVIDGRTLSAKGSIKGASAPEVDLEIALPAVTSEIARRYVPKPDLVPDGLSLPPSTWEVRLAAPLSVEETTGAPKALEVRLLKLSTEGLQAAAKGRVGLAGGKTWLTVNVPAVDLAKAAEFYGALQNRRLQGTGSAWMKLSGMKSKLHVDEGVFQVKDFSVLLPKNLSISKADITVRAFNRWKTIQVTAPKGGFTAYSNALTDVDLDARYVDGDVDFKKLDFTWNESRARLKGCIEGGLPDGKVRVDGVFDRLKVDEFYAAVENIIAQRRAEKGLKKDPNRAWDVTFRDSIPDRFPDLIGRLHFKRAHSPNFNSDNFKLLFDLQDLSRGLKRAAGNFEISFGPGRISNVPVVRKGNGLLNVLILPFSFMHSLLSKSEGSFGTAQLNTLDINRVSANCGAQNGVVGIRYINFDSPQFLAFAEGDADFPRESVRMEVWMRAQRKRGTLPDRLVDTRGRPSLRLGLLDDLTVPTTKIKLNKMKADEIEEKIAAGATRGRPLADLESRLQCGRKP